MPSQNDYNTIRYYDDTSSFISSLISNRVLQDDGSNNNNNSTSAPTNDEGNNDFSSTFTGTPTETPFIPSSPTSAPAASNNSLLEYNPSFGMLVLILVLVLLLVLCWNWCRYLKIRREQYQLQITSERADTVLGDMQMVEHDEYDDDDPELL